jgi:hypothetical protein
MESIVVQSYFSHVPGELSKLWNVGSVARIRSYHNLRHITLLATILGSIQYFGTLPFMLHRVFVRFVQPFLFGGLVLLWTIVISSPIYIALMSLMLTIVVAFGVYKYIYGMASSNKLTPITPIVDEGPKETNDGSEIVVGDIELEDHEVLIHLDLNDFQQARDDKDSSDESSNVHYNDISSDAISESSNDGKITIIGVSSDDDYGSDKVIDDDNDDDDDKHDDKYYDNDGNNDGCDDDYDNDDKGSCLNTRLEIGLVDSIHSSGFMVLSSKDSVEEQSDDI